jgi:hypothetical protein
MNTPAVAELHLRRQAVEVQLVFFSEWSLSSEREADSLEVFITSIGWRRSLPEVGRGRK